MVTASRTRTKGTTRSTAGFNPDGCARGGGSEPKIKINFSDISNGPWLPRHPPPLIVLSAKAMPADKPVKWPGRRPGPWPGFRLLGG